MRNKIIENTIENIVAIILTIIWMYILNNYYDRVPFITEKFTVILPMMNIGIIFSVISHMLRILLPFKVIKGLTEIVSNIISVVIMYLLYFIFPFSTSFETLFRILLVIIIIGTIIGTIVQIVQLLIGKYPKD